MTVLKFIGLFIIVLILTSVFILYSWYPKYLNNTLTVPNNEQAKVMAKQAYNTLKKKPNKENLDKKIELDEEPLFFEPRERKKVKPKKLQKK